MGAWLTWLNPHSLTLSPPHPHIKHNKQVPKHKTKHPHQVTSSKKKRSPPSFVFDNSSSSKFKSESCVAFVCTCLINLSQGQSSHRVFSSNVKVRTVVIFEGGVSLWRLMRSRSCATDPILSVSYIDSISCYHPE